MVADIPETPPETAPPAVAGYALWEGEGGPITFPTMLPGIEFRRGERVALDAKCLEVARTIHALRVFDAEGNETARARPKVAKSVRAANVAYARSLKAAEGRR